MTDSSPRFLMRKWYLDVIDQEGRGLIGYQADIEWRKLKISYDGVIPVGAAGFKAKANFSSRSVITESDHGLEWKSGNVTGNWKRHSPGADVQLLNSPEGSIHWYCLQPSAFAAVNVSGVPLQGMGYAERIEMTIPPWQLPIKELLWGRYVSDHHAIVWIKWIGPDPKQIILHNGLRIEDGLTTTEEISFSGLHLTLPDTLIRKGGLRESVFSGFEKLASWFPNSILSLHEEKWYGRGLLRQGSDVIDEGNVIHEKVVWP